MSNVDIAVIGATGAVGRVALQILEERNFPVTSLKLLASSRSAGKRLPFRGNELQVEELNEHSFEDVNYVLSSAGGSITLPPSSLTAIVKLERVRSDGFSNSIAICRPARAVAFGPFGPRCRSSLRDAARSR